MFTAFSGGNSGAWQVMSLAPAIGEPFAPVTHLSIDPLATLPAPPQSAGSPSWQLIGIASHVRYVERAEKTSLTAVQAGLGRPQATRAALIPIRKSTAWWDLPQDERRRIFEDKSRHIADSMKYLPAIARQLYHCRDLGEPFDFVTRFEYAPEHATMFEDLVGMLRRTEEWTYVEREVDLRLARSP